MRRSLKSVTSFRSDRSRSKSPKRLAHHADDTNSSFVNPWPSAKAPTSAESDQHSFPLGWYPNALHEHEHARKLEVVTPDWGASDRKAKNLERCDCVTGTWLGHASALVELPLIKNEIETYSDTNSAWLLFDPIFSMRAGPTQYTGPRRYHNNPPCQVEDLPGCDAIFISHNHYDHLDLSSIKALIKKFPEALYFVPLGIRSWLINTGVQETKAYELDWWQECNLTPQDLGRTLSEDAKETSSLRVTCVPAQHNSGRAAIDSGSTLWCGWIVELFTDSKTTPSSIRNPQANDNTTDSKIIDPEPKENTSTPEPTSTPPPPTPTATIYHAGDTGYRRSPKSTTICPAFTQISRKFHPPNLSFIPIWRGGTLSFISSLGLRLSHNDIASTFHGGPRDAIDIHTDVKSKCTVPIHFGTFVGSENEILEAVIEFGEACKRGGVGRFDLVDQVDQVDVDGVGDGGDDDDDDDDEKEEGGEEEEEERRKSDGKKKKKKKGNGCAGILDIGGSVAVKLN